MPFGVGGFDEVGVRAVVEGFSPYMSQLGAMEKQTQGFGSRVGSALRKGSLVGGAALLGLAAVSVKSFADFDAAMTQSLAIMGDVSGEMEGKMSKAARNVAKTTTFSATQAAESYFFLASAGLDAEASVAALPRVAKFAQAGMFDMAQATDLATDAQSALGLTIRDDAVKNMENLTRVTDVLVKANTLANASVEQFATSLTKKAGAALKILDKDVEEGVAVLAAFADQGVKGEIAGERLSIVLRDLQKASIDNREEFDKLGIKVYDANGEMRNLGKIVGELEKALGPMSDEQKKVTLGMLGFQEESQASLLTLLGTSDAIKRYEKELRNAGGTTDEVARKQLQTFNAQMTLLWHQVQDVFIVVGSKLVPALTRFMRLLREDIIPAVEKFIRANLKEVLTGIGVVGAIAGTAIAVAWAPVVAGFIAAAAPIVAVGAALAAIGAGAALIEKKTGFFSQKLLPALMDVVGVIQEWWKVHGPAILRHVREFADAIEDVATEIGRFLLPALDTLSDLWKNLQPVLREVWRLFDRNILPVLKAVGGFLLEHKPILIGVAAAILLLTNPWLAVAAAIAVVLAKWDEISGFFADVGSVITGFVDKAVESVLGFPVIGEIIEHTLEEAKIVAETVLKLIPVLFEAALETIKNTFRLFVAVFKGDWGEAWDALKDQAKVIWDLLSSVFSIALDAVGEIIVNRLEFIKGIGSDLGQLILDAAALAWDQLKTALSNSITSMETWVTNNVASIEKIGTAIGDAVIGGAKAVMSFPGLMADLVSEFWQWLGRVPKFLFNLGKYIGEQIWEGIKSGMGSLGDLFPDITPWQGLIPGAQRGAWKIPEVMPALLHPGEMVVPARPAEVIRDVIRAPSLPVAAPIGGSGGSTFNANINVESEGLIATAVRRELSALAFSMDRR